MDTVVSSKYPDLVRVRSVQPLTGFTVHVTFTDSTERDIDLGSYLEGPIFEPIRQNPDMFRRIFVDHGALAWPNGADIDPDTLYYEGPPPWAQEEASPRRPKRRTSRTRPRSRAVVR